MLAASPQLIKLIWELAIARKLYASALADRRFFDANYYLKNIQAVELRAQALLGV